MEELGETLMYKGLIGAVSTCFILFTTPATANNEPPNTVGELYSACEPIAGRQSFTLSDMALFNAGYCMGVIHTKASEMGLNCIFQEESHPLRARTGGVSTAALIQAFVNYARDNPQEWEGYMFGGVAAAFKKYFPCD
jgi:Mn2+/Fe2+ NRAMP family transporter